jgi:hypothetical protein
MDSTDVSDLTWIEVTHPIADAMRALAGCVQDQAQRLDGASIAVSEEGTLLLNRRAWELCGHLLNALPDLETTEAPLDETRPVRFLLISTK